MREIAIRAGRGKISSSTVHNIFRSSRVPRWAFLEQIVNALGGANDRDRFLVLWQAACARRTSRQRRSRPEATPPRPARHPRA